ncbi:hypothetical protein T310_10322, partial [Rasamsonia emersonii CBS 393.64]
RLRHPVPSPLTSPLSRCGCPASRAKVIVLLLLPSWPTPATSPAPRQVQHTHCGDFCIFCPITSLKQCLLVQFLSPGKSRRISPPLPPAMH